MWLRGQRLFWISLRTHGILTVLLCLLPCNMPIKEHMSCFPRWKNFFVRIGVLSSPAHFGWLCWSFCRYCRPLYSPKSLIHSHFLHRYSWKSGFENFLLEVYFSLELLFKGRDDMISSKPVSTGGSGPQRGSWNCFDFLAVSHTKWSVDHFNISGSGFNLNGKTSCWGKDTIDNQSGLMSHFVTTEINEYVTISLESNSRVYDGSWHICFILKTDIKTIFVFSFIFSTHVWTPW